MLMNLKSVPLVKESTRSLLYRELQGVRWSIRKLHYRFAGKSASLAPHLKDCSACSIRHCSKAFVICFLCSNKRQPIPSVALALSGYKPSWHVAPHSPTFLNRLFDHSFLCKAEQLAERVVDEAVFTFLLCAVFCEALRQSYGLSLKQEALALCIPEIGAYTWFVPSKPLQTRLNSLLTSCMLSPIPIYLAGEMYEGALTREEKKTLGQYYTPPAIADHLLDQVGYAPDTGTCEGPLLDVATGFGIFLAQATKRLVSALRAQNVCLEQICHTVERHIQGYDINPFAVIATKFHVLATLLDTLAPTTQQAGNVLNCYRLPGVRTADTLLQPLVDPKASPSLCHRKPSVRRLRRRSAPHTLPRSS